MKSPYHTVPSGLLITPASAAPSSRGHWLVSFFSPSFASHSRELSLSYKGWYRWASGVVQGRTRCLWMAWSAAWWQGGYSVKCYIQQHRPWVSNVRLYRGESGGSKSPSHYLLLFFFFLPLALTGFRDDWTSNVSQFLSGIFTKM